MKPPETDGPPPSLEWTPTNPANPKPGLSALFKPSCFYMSAWPRQIANAFGTGPQYLINDEPQISSCHRPKSRPTGKVQGVWLVSGIQPGPSSNSQRAKLPKGLPWPRFLDVMRFTKQVCAVLLVLESANIHRSHCQQQRTMIPFSKRLHVVITRRVQSSTTTRGGLLQHAELPNMLNPGPW